MYKKIHGVVFLMVEFIICDDKMKLTNGKRG